MRALAIFLMLFWASSAQAATILPPAPFTFTNGTTADATQVNANFNSIITNTNTFAAENGANASITSLTGLTTPLSIGQGGTGQATKTAALNALSPLTTFGDFLAFDGTNNVRVPRTSVFDIISPLTTQGDVLYFNGASNARLGAGANGQFLQTQGAGANPIWATLPGAINLSYVNVTQSPYNAVCNSTTDDTTAIQNAVNAVEGTGRGLFFPTLCKITSAITINNSLLITGAGYQSGIVLGSATQNGFVITSTFPVSIQNLRMVSIGGQSAGAAIECNSSGNLGSTFQNLTFENIYDGILSLSGCVDVKISTNGFFTFAHHAIEWNNAANAQQADVSIISNNFRNFSTVGTAVYIISGGGFRVVSNKVNLCANAVVISINTTGLPVGGATFDMLISNNSLEGMGTTGILVTETDTSSLFNVQIVDNEMTMGVANTPFIWFQNPGNINWLQGFQIIGNALQNTQTNTGAGINLAAGNSGVVTGNILYGTVPSVGLQMSAFATLGTSNTHTLQATTGYSANGAGAGWVNTN